MNGSQTAINALSPFTIAWCGEWLLVYTPRNLQDDSTAPETSSLEVAQIGAILADRQWPKLVGN